MNFQMPRGMSGSKCPQCGYYHPPVPAGETCQMATTKKSTIDYGTFLKQLRNICHSQIEKRNLDEKSAQKLLKHVLIEVTKTLENYKE